MSAVLTHIDVAGRSLEREAESQFLDLDGVLTFAEKIVTVPTRLGVESLIDQRQRLQQVFFPEVLTFEWEGIWNTCKFLSL